MLKKNRGHGFSIPKMIRICIIALLMLSLNQVGYAKEKKGVRIGKYLLFIGVGDWSYRDTNIYLEDYGFIGGWNSARIVWYGEFLPFGIYITGVIAQSNYYKPWENNYVFGIGVEKYVFEDIEPVSGLPKNIRFYLEYLRIGYTKEKAEEWIPSYDIRAGLDVYKDYGIGKDKIQKLLWGEVWANFAWQKTNFYIKDYNSLAAGLNIKAGLRLPKNTSFSLMPYCVADISWVGRHDFYWQNRGLIGVGVRIMPFAKANFDLWNRLKIFAEYFFSVVYLKEKASEEIPGYDFRVGITYSIGLWK